MHTHARAHIHINKRVVCFARVFPTHGETVECRGDAKETRLASDLDISPLGQTEAVVGHWKHLSHSRGFKGRRSRTGRRWKALDWQYAGRANAKLPSFEFRPIPSRPCAYSYPSCGTRPWSLLLPFLFLLPFILLPILPSYEDHQTSSYYTKIIMFTSAVTIRHL